ncbi:hypothetical protein DENSPDRAFT_88814 [Dentipellis sp. KUC8613]|nr:hypothetical protein DENSPDRAFT_88814 [Dentipellis sp. KUC8613]
MSRLPQPTRSTSKPTASPSTSRLAPPSSASRIRSKSPSPAFPTSRHLQVSPTPSSSNPTRLRTKSTPKASTHRKPDDPVPPSPSKNALSIKEAIALKRAEAKKALAGRGSPSKDGDAWSGLENADPFSLASQDDGLDLDMGRWSIRETIERAQNSGNINLSSRSLVCLPSALFEIHLGVKPEKLRLVPEEPPLPEGGRKKPANGASAPSWFEQRDLETLKAWSNEIVEIQPEISLFGSLKTIDLHNNRLTKLPETFADLTHLTALDLSHNQLTSFPTFFFALPALLTIDISHNALTALPFNAPFADDAHSRSRYRTDDFFTPAVVRADTPLPRLTSLNASHNKITAAAIDVDALPQSLTKLDLSDCPVTSGSGSSVAKLFSALAKLPKLEQVRMKSADLDDRAFPSDVLASASEPFSKLKFLDLEETQVTRDAVVKALSGLSRELDFDATADSFGTSTPSRLSPAEDVTKTVKIVIGKKVVREAWEVEADRRAQLRAMRSAGNLRAAAQAQPESPPLPLPSVPSTSSVSTPRKEEPKVKTQPVGQPVVKEQWEIEAEQGLLTEGGRRRARALAAQQSSSASSTSLSSEGSASSLLKGKYWDDRNHALTLPPLVPPNRNAFGHGRGFSLASSPSSGSVDTDLTLPTAALPLSLIVSQPFADTLRVLDVKGRRADASFTLPETDGPFLPHLEELSLEGCNFGDEVPLAIGEDKKRDDLLGTLACLFPSLRTLDLSYNLVSSAPLTSTTISSLVLSAPGRAGLRHLRLRGNKLANLDGFVGLAKELFVDGSGDKARWTLEELDVRDNAVEALAGELGLLPLEVFLVEGNLFRIPARRVWEREGTKGLLAWLRGRLA